MHKITKGLKKKKKGKKNKHKEEDLFDAAELAAYRLEHQAVPAEPGEVDTQTTQPGADNDEWQRFKALTAGVDSILKKTQGDLDRIKETSYFQRKPPGSQSQPRRPAPPQDGHQKEKRWVGFEEGSRIDEPPPTVEVEEAAALPEPEPEVEESEEEEEEEEDDGLFDTSYVDVVTSGDIKLAYIPDSPEEEVDEYDPFDTSIVEKVIKPDVDKKGKKLVSLGCAVDVLTGILDNEKVLNAVLPTTGKKRRVIPKNDLLLTSFDEGNPDGVEVAPAEPVAVKSLLDDDEPLGASGFAPVEAAPANPAPEQPAAADSKENLKDLVAEFDLINESPKHVPQAEPGNELDRDLEDGFAALAAESFIRGGEGEFDDDDQYDTLDETLLFDAPDILKNTNTIANFFPSPDVDIVLNERHPWAEFEDAKPRRPGPSRPPPPSTFTDHAIAALAKDLDIDPLEADPFDTSFADNILPGKAELRLIENEILRSDKDLELNEARILSHSDSDFDFDPRAGEAEVQSSVSIQITDPAGESQEEIRSLSPSHRDLLGGSTTDLSKICHEPIEPSAKDDGELGYVDPFDTSVVDVLVAPGKTELKFLEKELIGDEGTTLKRSLSDEDFDPRKEEDIPTVQEPIRRESIAERPSLLDVNKPHKVVAFDLPTPSARPDLLVVGHEEGSKISKPLTPFYVEKKSVPFLGQDEPEEETDPFDTTFAANLPPGKAELKLIESEFVGEDLKNSLSDQDFNPREGKEEGSPKEKVLTNPGRRFSECPQQVSGNLGRRFSDFTGDRKRTPPTSLNIKRFVVPTVPEVPPIPTSPPKPDLLVTHEEFNAKALTPAVEERIEYLDPFDTSIAVNLLPGKAELKVLEEEFINEGGETSLKRSYTDPDFNPREEVGKKEIVGEKPDLLNLPSSPGARVLTPFVGCSPIEDINYDDIDPFDTSIVGELIPGKAELRVLESELFGQ